MPSFAVYAYYVCHDWRHAEGFEFVVEQAAPPTTEEATALAYAQAERRLARSRPGFAGEQIDLVTLKVREVPADTTR